MRLEHKVGRRCCAAQYYSEAAASPYLRSFVAADAVAVQRYADNRNIWINLRDIFPYPYTLENAQGLNPLQGCKAALLPCKSSKLSCKAAPLV